jgi:PII-like signaling protein
MTLDGRALLVRCYLGDADEAGGRPLAHAIVELLRDHGIAGATVIRGVEGFGAKQHLHTDRILSLSLDLPVIVEFVDTEERVRAILPEVDALMGDGLVIAQAVEVLSHRSRPDAQDVAT